MTTETTFAGLYDEAIALAAREGKASIVNSVGTMPVQPATNDLIRVNIIEGSDEMIDRDPGRDFLTIKGSNVTVNNPHELSNYVDWTDDKGGNLTYNAGLESGLVIAEKGANVFNDTHGGNLGFVSGAGNDTVNASTSTGKLAISMGAGDNTAHFGSGVGYDYSEGNDHVYAGSGNLLVQAGVGSELHVSAHAGGTLTVHAGDSTLSQVFGAAGAHVTYTGSGSLISGGGDETLNGSADRAGFTGYVTNTIPGGNTILSGGFGNDTIVAGEGNQTLSGGAGSNVFDIAANGTLGHANIVITDFGSSAGNMVGLYGFGASEVAKAMATLTVSGGNSTMILGDKTSVTFMHVTDLKATSFIGDK